MGHCPIAGGRRPRPATQVDQLTLKIDLIWSWEGLCSLLSGHAKLPVRRLLASYGDGCTLLRGAVLAPEPAEAASRPQKIPAAGFCRPSTSVRERALFVGPGCCIQYCMSPSVRDLPESGQSTACPRSTMDRRWRASSSKVMDGLRGFGTGGNWPMFPNCPPPESLAEGEACSCRRAGAQAASRLQGMGD